ncbi:MAG: bifunctional 4-hydroxy-2-oxoglutarate aldolase/2-dehydro-3-deoxy-phosphogluconate aldolase [Dehalococcoidia bacterium]
MGDQPPRPPIPEQISSSGVIAIARGLGPEALPSVADALAEAGVRAVEVTLNSSGAFAAIEALARDLGVRLLVGAGTVLTVDSAARAVDAGARFLVMPHVDVDLVRWAAMRGIAAFPGAFSPTEILRGWSAGATAVKLFPASAVGPTFVRDLRGPFPQIPLIPTGGVTVESAPLFIRAGAVAVGVGSWLTGPDEAAVVRARARSLIEAVRLALEER